MKANKKQTKDNTVAYSKRWSALFLLCTAQFIVIMDTSIIGVALPAIKADLGYSQSGLQWIFNAYVILLGGFLLLGGRLSDLFGARKIFMWGFAILTGASLLAGIAWSEAILNTGRALQGLGSALIAPAALTLVLSKFTDPNLIKHLVSGVPLLLLVVQREFSLVGLLLNGFLGTGYFLLIFP